MTKNITLDTFKNVPYEYCLQKTTKGTVVHHHESKSTQS